MDLSGGRDLAGPPALLAQRVLSQLLVSNAPPRSAVALSLSGVAIIAFVALRLIARMNRTKPSGSQDRTTGIRARTLGFQGHQDHLLLGIKKATGDFSSMAKAFCACALCVFVKLR